MASGPTASKTFSLGSPGSLPLSPTSFHSTRYRGINVGWKKNQHHIGHFLVLVEYMSIALSYKMFKCKWFVKLEIKHHNI